MSYAFELATEADDADLRAILAATPMAGRVALAFRREPSFFAASVEGHVRQIVAARDTEAGNLVGFGCRSLRRVNVNGQPRQLGYLSTLRLLPEHRNRGLVARGYAFFRKLHRDGLAPLYLTTIAEGNDQALALLTSGRAGLPQYHPAGEYHTGVIPLRTPSRGTIAPGIRAATGEDMPALLYFLNTEGPRRQFFPTLTPNDFTQAGSFGGLKASDFMLAFHGKELVGTLAAWDQSAYRQTVVHAYSRGLRWLRPLYNGWARWRAQPPLPRVGQAVRYLTGALPVVKGDDPALFRSLVQAVCARCAGGVADFLCIGLHGNDPLLPALRSLATAWYRTHLYLVCWDDGEALRAELDGRVPYLELGTL